MTFKRRREIRQLQEAVFELQDRLAAIAPEQINECPAFGCCGCGAPMADVAMPCGESYCWGCVRRNRLAGFRVLIRAGEVPR